MPPFRFSASMPALSRPVASWREQVRRIEDLGFSSVSVSDHLVDGWAMDPVVAMTVAAEATSRLRVLSMVLCNDFRHPVLLHKALANLDHFSDGRVEIGLGAAWKRADHDAAGLTFDPPGVRIDRLAESIDVLKLLFGDTPASYLGKHYQLTALDGLPKPVQRPHPPLLVGGGGRRVLELAGRAADIVGINPRLGAGRDPALAGEDLSPDGVAQKVSWARDAARAAGRDPDRLEVQLSLLAIRVRHQGRDHAWTSGLARSVAPPALAGSPAALYGDVEACVDALVERRERYGISYLHLGGNLDAAAPIVARLAGR